MKSPLKLNIEGCNDFIETQHINDFQPGISELRKQLFEKSGKGNDFLGWMDLPHQMDELKLAAINHCAKRIRSIAKYVVVTGIGGSYLGAKAVIEALKSPFSAYENEAGTEVLYAGHHLSQDYLAELLSFLKDKEFALVVISKSGTTTEPAIAFRMLKQLAEEKYKEQASERIITITDEKNGALRQLSDQNNYESFIIPGDVGGRYSVLTAVGLLPIAIAGFDIQELINGARAMEERNRNTEDVIQNPVNLYAACRNILYQKGKPIELLATYQPQLSYMSEWWKQLFGESEGKQKRGIFPASVCLTTDLHSMGQYIQDGLRVLFETVISVEKSKHQLTINPDDQDLDQLNYLSGKSLDEVNAKAEQGTRMAHISGGVPNLQIQLSEISEYNLGQLIYFFEAACALSAYLLDVNPFDQPGVEDYKRNMFQLLKKPGY